MSFCDPAAPKWVQPGQTDPDRHGHIAQPEWSPFLLVRVSALGFFGQFAPGLGDLQQCASMLLRHDARQTAAFLGISPVSCGFAHRPPATYRRYAEECRRLASIM